MEDYQTVAQKYQPLYQRFENVKRLAENPPLLAHYTSISVLESILKNDEIWLSNPLFMNDLEELRFGVLEGSRIFRDPERRMRAGGTPERAGKLLAAYDFYLEQFENNHALDTYIFCLSEHDRDNTDGLLSMWRGYGSQGNGAAIVFNPAKATLIPNSILTLATVKYASTDERIADLESILNEWATITSGLNLSEEMIGWTAHQAFWVILTYALTTKHKGFSEEREWRLIYLSALDQNKLLKESLSHHVGPRGVEPKLKLKIEERDGIMTKDMTLTNIVQEIILGPSISSKLAIQSVMRMMQVIQRPQYCDRIRASSIPLRQTPGRE